MKLSLLGKEVASTDGHLPALRKRKDIRVIPQNDGKTKTSPNY
jgi:hypothetical protein